MDDSPRPGRFRAALGLATLLMLGLSWPLWVEPSALPLVPFVAYCPTSSPAVSRVVFGTLATSVALAAAGVYWRASLAISLMLLVVLVIQDQHRFQPWIYQYLVLGLVLVGLPDERGLRLVRWWYVALYVYSGVSKLDVSFRDEMGMVFLATALRPFGLAPTDWPLAGRHLATLAMPVAVIAAGGALGFARTRRIGLVGTLGLHGLLLGILGPWGLGQSTIVLVWNGALMVEAVLIFGRCPAVQEAFVARPTWLARVVRAAFWTTLIVPVGESWGGLDAWPAFALYASHAERTAVDLHEDGLAALPPTVRARVSPTGAGPWRRLDLTGWSRDARGTPVYPSGRACNGLAEALAARYGGRCAVRVVQWGRADRWSGRRDRVECVGLAAIRRQGDRYRLNAHAH